LIESENWPLQQIILSKDLLTLIRKKSVDKMSMQTAIINVEEDNRKIFMELGGSSFLYTYAFNRAHFWENFIGENILAYQISGHTHIINEEGEMTMKEGQLVLARRNQFAKTTKIPIGNMKAQCVSVILSVECLQQYALEHGIVCDEKYGGEKMMLIEPNDFLNGYFSSLISYGNLWNEKSKKLETIKVNEAIELLLQMRPELKTFLFDFADPKKQDLKAFMMKNFRYNVSLDQFAKLSGRSLTRFKREFAEVFKTSPASWLKNERLAEAYHLIKEKGLRTDDIYHNLGFENLSHFYTVFKQKYGNTPSEICLGRHSSSEKLPDQEKLVV
jgi:AraC-like DNA-binding protein